MVDFRFYNPNNIFEDDTNPQGLAGEVNFALAKSFFHSREKDDHHICNITSATINDVTSYNIRCKQFDRNAGAAALYYEDGTTMYKMAKQEDCKEYHHVSYGNKYFKYFSEIKRSVYGHSEKLLMRDILDDLLSDNPSDQHEVQKPSSYGNSPNSSEFQVLKSLIDNAHLYKQYLQSKKLIVKMWSERPACTSETNVGAEGRDCTSFIKDICPAGSQFGHIVENYEPADNQNGAPKIENAWNQYKSAYKNHCSIS